MAVERVLGTENDPDVLEQGSEIEVVPEKTRQEELDEAIQVVVSGNDIFTQEELDELKSFQEALGISDEEAARMNVEAAMKSAAKDGEITEDEKSNIKKAAVEADMDANEAVETAKKKAKKRKSKK